MPFTAVVCLFGTTGSAVSLLNMIVQSTLDPTTELDGVALGAPTAFSYAATFDPATGAEDAGTHRYLATTSFWIAGHGTYTTSSLQVGLSSSTGYLAELLDSGSTYSFWLALYYSADATATPSFDASAPTPTVITWGTSGDLYGLGSVTFDQGNTLSKVDWNRVPDRFAALPITTTISAVPEPGSIGVATALLLGAAVGAAPSRTGRRGMAWCGGIQRARAQMRAASGRACCAVRFGIAGIAAAILTLTVFGAPGWGTRPGRCIPVGAGRGASPGGKVLHPKGVMPFSPGLPLRRIRAKGLGCRD
jgi:hypothetical protein